VVGLIWGDQSGVRVGRGGLGTGGSSGGATAGGGLGEIRWVIVAVWGRPENRGRKIGNRKIGDENRRKKIGDENRRRCQFWQYLLRMNHATASQT
jgi:hypothetical protein